MCTKETTLERVDFCQPVSLRSHGMDPLSMSQLEIEGTTSDKKWRKRKL